MSIYGSGASSHIRCHLTGNIPAWVLLYINMKQYPLLGVMRISAALNRLGAMSLLTFAITSYGAVVSTAQYDSYRSGTNPFETTLTVENVNQNTFGRLGSYLVDGQVMAQPLYVPALNIKETPTNVLFVATMHNSIYAFDATKPSSPPLWQTTLAPSVPAMYTGQCPAGSFGPETGILSTPTIDTQAGVLYTVYATPNGTGAYAYYIAALDILTGKHKAGSPTQITGSVIGTGYDSVGGKVTFNASMQNQRTALTLANGRVYAGFATCAGDLDPYHGWVMGYNASNVSVQTSIFNVTPNGGEGGVWQAGRGLATDASGNIYVATGNGTNSATDLSESVVKFGNTGTVVGAYPDPNSAALNEFDLDLGSGGPLYIGSLGLLLVGGKEGLIHVLNPAQIGASGNAEVQSFWGSQPCVSYYEDSCYQLFNSYVYWDNTANPLLYVWGADDVMRVYRNLGGAFNTTPESVGTLPAGDDAPAISLSSNGSDPATAIIWAVPMDGLVRAYQATNIANEIYNTGQNASRDNAGAPIHFMAPVVADGHVYFATQDNSVQVYGLLGTGGGFPSDTASFIGADTSTQGNWRLAYGADGYSIEADRFLNPSYAALAVSGASTYTWEASSADVRALQKASNPSDRIAASWYTGTSFTIDPNITDRTPHQVALYCVDWDSAGRQQTIGTRLKWKRARHPVSHHDLQWWRIPGLEGDRPCHIPCYLHRRSKCRGFRILLRRASRHPPTTSRSDIAGEWCNQRCHAGDAELGLIPRRHLLRRLFRINVSTTLSHKHDQHQHRARCHHRSVVVCMADRC